MSRNQCGTDAVVRVLTIHFYYISYIRAGAAVRHCRLVFYPIRRCARVISLFCRKNVSVNMFNAGNLQVFLLESEHGKALPAVVGIVCEVEQGAHLF